MQCVFMCRSVHTCVCMNLCVCVCAMIVYARVYMQMWVYLYMHVHAWVWVDMGKAGRQRGETLRPWHTSSHFGRWAGCVCKEENRGTKTGGISILVLMMTALDSPWWRLWHTWREALLKTECDLDSACNPQWPRCQHGEGFWLTRWCWRRRSPKRLSWNHQRKGSMQEKECREKGRDHRVHPCTCKMHICLQLRACVCKWVWKAVHICSVYVHVYAWVWIAVCVCEWMWMWMSVETLKGASLQCESICVGLHEDPSPCLVTWWPLDDIDCVLSMHILIPVILLTPSEEKHGLFSTFPAVTQTLAYKKQKEAS